MMRAEPESWWFHRQWSDFRRGSRQIQLRWQGGSATVGLYDEGVPATAGAFARALPVEIPFVQVAWSGEMLMSADAFSFGPGEAENEVRLVRPGDLTWDSKYGEVCLVYGTAECRLPSGPNTVTVFGSVVSGLDELVRFGAARRFEGIGSVAFSEIGEGA